MKFLKRILFAFFLLLFSLFVFLFVISRFYHKKAEQYIVAELNKHLASVVSIEDIKLDPFSKFPHISLTMSNSVVYVPGKEKTEKLMEFEKLFFMFSITDLFTSNYRIKKIDIKNGRAFFSVNENGKPNYEFWKKKENTDTLNTFIFLNNVRINAVDFVYTNKLKKDSVSLTISKAELSGLFSDESFSATLNTQSKMNGFYVENKKMTENRAIALTGKIEVDNTKGTYILKDTKTVIDDVLKFSIAGNFTVQEKSTLLNLKITGDELDIIHTLSVLPNEYVSFLNEYESTGVFGFNCNITGENSYKKSPAITASFTIKNGTVGVKNTIYKLTGVSLSGSYVIPENRSLSASVLTIKELKGYLGKENIFSEFTVSNLLNPVIDISVIGKSNLADIVHFLRIDTIINPEGIIDIAMRYSGPLKQTNEITKAELEKLSLSGKITFSNASFAVLNAPYKTENLSCAILVNNMDMKIKGLSFNYKKSDFSFTGYFQNCIPYFLFPDEQLIVKADLMSDALYPEEVFENPEKNTEESTYSFFLPDRITMFLNVTINELSFSKFNAKKITASTVIRPSGIRNEIYSLNTMDGNISGFFDVLKTNKGLEIASRLYLRKISVQKLFHDFDNFGQSVITHNDLKGTTDAGIDFSYNSDLGFNVIPESIIANADIEIFNGELINYKPLKEVPIYAGKNKMLNTFIKLDDFEKKLDHITFSKLSNTISIKNKVINIPFMSVQSSALSFELEGTHTFNDEINYNINFYLSEVLAKKEKDNREDLWEVKKDGTKKRKVFLTIKGTVDNPVVEYNLSSAKKQIQQTAAEEKKTIKSLLKEEFGIFKKDSTLKKNRHKNDFEFDIEWNDKMNPEKPSDTITKTPWWNKDANKKKRERKEESPDIEFNP